ncbi:MAG TPA: hypothetical protein PKH32_08485, partial [Verrucomicrobiota bacterium]|nr:hypothetical protein [Verrucomicrobiota bacterium]
SAVFQQPVNGLIKGQFDIHGFRHLIWKNGAYADATLGQMIFLSDFSSKGKIRGASVQKSGGR